MIDDENPIIIQLRARDVEPNFYGVYCSIQNGKPFVNPIVNRRWMDDGIGISFMLDSHNFLIAKHADEMLDVVEIPEGIYGGEAPEKAQQRRTREREKFLGCPRIGGK